MQWVAETLITEESTHARPHTRWSAKTAASVHLFILRQLFMGEAGERLEASDDADFTHGSERKKKKKKEPTCDKNRGFRISCYGIEG